MTSAVDRDASEPNTVEQRMLLAYLVARGFSLRRTESQHVARAAYCLGVKALSLCVWCAEKYPYSDRLVWRFALGGECFHCPYVGYDCLLVEGGAQ